MTSHPHSKVETKLYVTNFPSSATRQQLQQFFSRFGRVQECAIMWNSYAFIHYATMEEARRALEQANGALFLNRKLLVQLSTSRFRLQPKDQSVPCSSSSSSSSSSHPSSPSHKLLQPIRTEQAKLYCTNLPDQCQVNELKTLFSTFGQVMDCVILWDYYAFITYQNFMQAEQALNALNGFKFKDRHLIVEWSRASGRRQTTTSVSSPQSPPSPVYSNVYQPEDITQFLESKSRDPLFSSCSFEENLFSSLIDPFSKIFFDEDFSPPYSQLSWH